MATSQRIYLDNAATSWPKPEAVYAAVDRYQREWGAPVGRGTYREAVEVERAVQAVRKSIATLLGADDPRRVVLTASATHALNQAIHGVLRPGDHVVTTAVEHNSVLRPLRYWESRRQVEVTQVGCDASGRISADEVLSAVRPHTRLVAVSHASNVTGAVQPIAPIGRGLVDHPALLLIDAAQSIGHERVDVAELGADLVAASGHKGLLGPLGTGLLYIRPGIENQVESLIQGGTGTVSEQVDQPTTLPEKFESGNLNAPGLVGLAAALDYVLEQTVETLGEQVRSLAERLWRGLSAVKGVRLLGPDDPRQRTGVVSAVVEGYDPQEVAAMLESGYRIQVRAGLHCAPEMHRALGTLATGGTVRLSVGPLNTIDQIDQTVAAMHEIAATSSYS